jgi:hypothetical protein
VVAGAGLHRAGGRHGGSLCRLPARHNGSSCRLPSAQRFIVPAGSARLAVTGDAGVASGTDPWTPRPDAFMSPF